MRRFAGQTLTEVMLAAIFLATGGLVVYSASVNMMKGEAWKADRVYGQAALRDLVEVFSAFSYCDVQKVASRKIGWNDPEDVAITAAFEDKDVQKNFELDTSPLTALKFESFFALDKDDKPIVKTPTEMAKDPIYKTYRDTFERLELKRAVVFKDDPQTRGIVICAIRFKATSGQAVVLKMPFVTFFRPGTEVCP